MAVSRG
jgi:hypothetical protein